MAPTKWGIVSAGVISFEFANALTTFDINEHQTAAVAARSIEKAQEFAKKFDIPKAYGKYEDLAKDPNIDVVYIGSINPAHLELCKMMLEAGKPVLCEKPLAINVREVKEIIDLAKKKNVFLMEAYWSRFLPSYVKLKEELNKGSIGEVHNCHSFFGLDIDKPRMNEKALGGGTLIDLGIYCINFFQLVFDGEKPEKILATGNLNEDGVDTTVSAILTYSGGRTATFTSHCKVNMPNVAIVFGRKGNLKVPDPFWCSEKVVTPADGLLNMPFAKGRYPSVLHNAEGLLYEAQHVRECLQKGLKESPQQTHATSLMVMEIMDDIRKQIGVVYPQDKA